MSLPSRKILTSHDNLSIHTSEDNGESRSPPKPPRSAFMCFTDAKKKEILGMNALQKKEDVLKLVAVAWNELDTRERAFWDEEARNDKVRYVREKNDYKGEWILPKRRAKKHPLAPKRPMSAFLKYSQNKRSDVKEQNPSMSNTDVSRLLGEMWRNATDDERQPYVDEEQIERANYNERIKEWREEQGKIDASTRKSHHAVPKIQGSESQESKQSNEKRSRYDSRYARSAMADARSSRTFSEQQDRNVFRPYDGMYDNRNVPMSPNDLNWHLQQQQQQHNHHHYPRPHTYYPYNYPKMTPTLAMPNQDEHLGLPHSSSLSTDSSSRASRGNGESTSRNEYRSRSPLYQYQQPQPAMQQQPIKSYEPARNSRDIHVYEKSQLRGPSPPPHPPQDYRPNQEYDQYKINNGGSMNYSSAKSPSQSSRSNSHQYYENFYNLP